MCTLHLFYKCFRETPLLLAANRDELVSRAWECPSFLSKFPPIFGPKDTASGGTWCGVNAAGVVAALADHEGTLGNGTSLCSRGFVVKEALRHESAWDAAIFARAIAPACKSYTLILADARDAFVLENVKGEITSHTLGEGAHVVTNKRFGLPPGRDKKARLSLAIMEEMIGRGRKPLPKELSELLSRHGDPEEALCIHDKGDSGLATTSASIIELGPGGKPVSYLFAPGPPCERRFREVLSGF